MGMASDCHNAGNGESKSYMRLSSAFYQEITSDSKSASRFSNMYLSVLFT